MPMDLKRYPPNWLSEIRPRIMKRANNRCEFEGCGLEHLSIAYSFKGDDGKRVWFPYFAFGAKEVKVVITIAHLDHDEKNHDVKDERLMAMCQLHHLKYDVAEKKRRKQLND